jgi:hypothetical protein
VPSFLFRLDDASGSSALDSITGKSAVCDGVTYLCPTFGVAGIKNTAANFAAFTDGLVLNSIGSFNMSLGVSIEMWINSSTSSRGAAAQIGNSSSVFGIGVCGLPVAGTSSGPGSGTNGCTALSSGGSQIFGVTTATLADGNWHFFAATGNFSSNTIIVYIDGKAQPITQISQSSNDQAPGIIIGGSINNSSVVGTYDEIAIYNGIISAQQVLNDYQNPL